MVKKNEKCYGGFSRKLVTPKNAEQKEMHCEV